MDVDNRKLIQILLVVLFCLFIHNLYLQKEISQIKHYTIGISKYVKEAAEQSEEASRNAQEAVEYAREAADYADEIRDEIVR